MFRFCDKNSKIILISPQKTFKKQQKLPKNSSFASQSRNFFLSLFCLAESPVRGGKFIGRGGAPAEPLCYENQSIQAPLGASENPPVISTTKLIKTHQSSSNFFWWSLADFDVFGGEWFPVKTTKTHQSSSIFFLMSFDGFWCLWWQMFPAKTTKPHQSSSNF